MTTNKISKTEALAIILRLYGVTLKHAPQCVCRFVRRMDSLPADGTLDHEFSAYFGDVLTLCLMEVDNLGGGHVQRIWNLKMPKSATVSWTTRRATTVTFSGWVGYGADTEAADERTCDFRAAHIAESNSRYPRKTDDIIIVAADIPALVESCVNLARHEITEDMKSGRVPKDVRNFSTLHDFVDANEYGGLCEDAFSLRLHEEAPALGHMDLAQLVQDKVHAWLASR